MDKVYLNPVSYITSYLDWLQETGVVPSAPKIGRAEPSLFLEKSYCPGLGLELGVLSC